ncbi:hypothetical protein AP75_00975 [Kaistella haifensis DSM 19056]|uniref:Lipoprotein n=1 Tax=Kaistella haifensis DSM 19056 TaxID=1450526 RepID=A0A246BCY6_9FLAO|nr:hypothetical protein [Kaistella haifensis]OWK99548.1 hypothetical protein AP75_00975 [Kaistella haifensis DSM 19056]
MNIFKTILISFIASLAIIACKKEGKGKSFDFTEVKNELKLSDEKSKKFDEITAKYSKIQEENYNAATANGRQMDRIALLSKQEKVREQQAVEMATVLTPVEMVKFNDFVDKNSRKRPRYNDELLSKIKTNAELTNEEFQVVNAANDAFEKAFSDAHDVYHGNNELAEEYWQKFDTQRKAAIQSALPAEKYQKFEETVKEIQFKGRE